MQSRPGTRKRKAGRGLTVGVVSNHASEREALVQALGGQPGLRALDCGDGAAESVSRVRDLSVSLVLLALDTGPAASFAGALHGFEQPPRCVVLLRSESQGSLERLAATGVLGFVPRGAGLASCVRSLRAVARVGFDCPSELAAILVQGKTRTNIRATQGQGSPAGLHGRRLQVAECIADGLSNKEIGDRLGIREGTVKNHVHAVLEALAVRRRWEVGGALRHHTGPLGLVRRAHDDGE